MTMSEQQPQVFGTGLIALDLVMSADPAAPVRSWAGGTCGNVLSILAYLGWDAFPIARLNTDSASQRVKADMKRWGVKLDFASCPPTTHTPIIIQEIRRGRNGAPTHRFTWACPRCGEWLPSFKAVTQDVVEAVSPRLRSANVFFIDRLSRAALTLAAQASDEGSVVIFEPAGNSDSKMFAEALKLSHIIKYANQRLASVGDVMEPSSAVLVEVQTLGSQGLRFRLRLGRGVSGWKHLGAIKAPRIADTCGSGDWCTAGLIAKVGATGLVGLRQAGAKGIQAGLRYGQALAAWNCGFEGARGGMYAVDRPAFDAQIEALMSGRNESVLMGPQRIPRGTKAVPCPACPPGKPRGPSRAASEVRRASVKVPAA
jgi:sugar/nucleoside kinase (ribokinase family)